MSHTNPSNQKNRIWIALIALVILNVLLLACIMIRERMHQEERKAWMEQLATVASQSHEIPIETPIPMPSPEPEQEAEEEIVPEVIPTPIPTPTINPIEALMAMNIPIPADKSIDFEYLTNEVNEDIYAWIYIPGTNIDYPVLRHPTDNNFYLTHNLDGSSGYPGCVFTQNYNSLDFTDPVTVMYAHDMRSNDTMFHQLHKFRDPDFFDEYEYVYIYTPEELLVYRVFATYIYSDEHLFYNHDFNDSQVFLSFFADIFEKGGEGSLIREDADISADSKVLTLSTCIKNMPENRWLVNCVLMNPN